MVESPVLRASAAPDSLIALDRCPYHRQSACRMYWAWHSLSSCFQPKACRVKSSTQYVSGRFADHRESAAGPPRGKRERTCVVDETSATSFGSLERGGTRRLVKLDSDQQRSDPFKSFDLTRYGFILLRLGVSASLRLMHEARRLLIRRYQRTGQRPDPGALQPIPSVSGLQTDSVLLRNSRTDTPASLHQCLFFWVYFVTFSS